MLVTNQTLCQTYASPAVTVSSSWVNVGICYSCYYSEKSSNEQVASFPRHQLYEGLISGPKSRLGDRPCTNYQVHARLLPQITGRSATNGITNFDGNSTDLQNYLRLKFTDRPTVIGECAFNSNMSGTAIIHPSWGSFQLRNNPIITGQRNQSIKIRSTGYYWIPLSSVQFGLVRTSVTVSQYENATSIYMDAVSVTLTSWVESFKLVNGVYTSTQSAGTTLRCSSRKSDTYALAMGCINGNLNPLALGGEIWSSFDHHIDDSKPHLTMTYSDAADSRCSNPVSHKALQERLAMGMLVCSNTTNENYPSNSQWHDMSLTALDNCAYTSCNSIAFLRDFRRFGSEIEDGLKLLKNPLSLKAWSSLYLGVRYGSRLTMSDLKSIGDGLREAKYRLKSKRFSVVRSKLTTDLQVNYKGWTAKREMIFKIGYRTDKDLLHLVTVNLYNWGLLPTTENLWDLVPYSFVLDWFVGINKLCSAIDRRGLEQSLDILGCTYSYKDTYTTTIDLTEFGYEATTVSYTVYHRYTRSSLPHATLFVDWGHSSSINLVDAVFLLIQRILK